MLERRRTVESIGLELAALRAEHELQNNLILRMADLLYADPHARDLLGELQALMQETAAWAASIGDHQSAPAPLARPGA